MVSNSLVLLTHIASGLRYLLVFIALFTTVSVLAQTMQGHVTDMATGKPLFLVSVLNEHSKLATSTDANGFYSILAQPGDNIRFSSVGYKTFRKIKPASVLIATVDVTMDIAENELKEFTLKASRLSRYQLDSIERAETYKLPLQRTPPSAFNSPVSAIAELFSKRAKQTYKFQENFRNGEIEKFIDTRYSPAMVTKLTGLTGDTVGYFMYINPMPYNFARVATDLELKMWVRSNYKEWLKNPVIDSNWVIK